MAADLEPGKFGAFGKIPALGDFFRLSLPQSFIDPWDAFLQASLVAGRSAKAEAWTEYYMTAPIWRFALAAGVAGPDPVFGVVMPSVDRVGRQFPLTLAQVARFDTPLRPLISETALLAALEDIALDALDDSMGREALAQRLETLPGLPDFSAAALRISGGGVVARSDGPAALALDLALAQAPKVKAVFAASLEVGSRLVALPALPEGEAAAALFDLDASFWGEGRG